MKPTSNKALYEDLKDRLLKQILDGEFRDGDFLPSEHQLAKQYDLSRVTVRKALAELKAAKVVRSAHGRGTMVTHRQHGYQSQMKVIALVASTQHRFFAQFYEELQRVASDCLVIFKHDFSGTESYSTALYEQFLDIGIRHIVLWPVTPEVDPDVLRRVRAVGVNLIQFDHGIENDFADFISVDNTHAVQALVAQLRQDGCRRLAYLTWSNLPLTSTIERDAAFVSTNGSDKHVYRLTWPEQPVVEMTSIYRQVRELVAQLATLAEPPDGVVCVCGQLAIAIAESIGDTDLAGIRVAAVDAYPEMDGLDILAYAQPLSQLAEKVYGQLQEQSSNARQWQAKSYQLRGELTRFRRH